MTPTTIIAVLIAVIAAFILGKVGKHKAVQDAKTVEKIKDMTNSEVADDLEKRAH